MRVALALALALPLAARADEGDPPAATFDEYQANNETACVGPADGRQTTDSVWEHGGFRYTVNGARAKVLRTSPRQVPTQVRVGIISSIGDDSTETQANVTDYLAKFKEADVDAVIVGGDTAFEEMEIELILGRIAALGVPVYGVIGNKESRGGWNRAVRAAWKAHPNVLNLDLVRVVDLEGWDVVSLPGYYDKAYNHQGGSCLYKPADAKGLKALAAAVEGPVMLVTHGPPRQTGKGALDFVPGAGNVGDPDLAAAIADAKIPFGVFGHILEAGGRATDLSGRREVKPLAFADALYLNPGGANSLPWRMNTGPESYGLAMLVTIEGKRAKYELLRSPRRVALGD